MTTDLSHVNRAASHAVATALAPKTTSADGTTAQGSGAPRSNVARVNATSAAATAKATSTGSSTSTTDPSTITSSDFLTLLVGELKNQDPTQPTDPNAYITQLVGVNSLEQLIQINTGITSLDSAATATTPPPTPTAGV